jgi:hypothetical protein
MLDKTIVMLRQRNSIAMAYPLFDIVAEQPALFAKRQIGKIMLTL